jgi:hypothetical protein
MIAIKSEAREQNNWTKVSTDTFVSSVQEGCQGGVNMVETRFRDPRVFEGDGGGLIQTFHRDSTSLPTGHLSR